MANVISDSELDALFHGDTPFALIDVRESGEYNSSHIPGAALIPRRRIEFIIEDSVPAKGVHVVVCDDDCRRAPLAAATLERLGYTNVSVLDGGVNRWSARDFPTEWGVNVPSKDFGEMLEVVHHVPEISAEDLHERIERGDKLVILDTRTPEEYQRFAIPGGRSMPGGELALRITDVVNEIDDDTTVILNCAGRTRSITGTRVLQRMGIEALGLKNGTSGWLLAGFELENGADRVELPEVSDQGHAAAEEYAARLAAEDGVRYLSPDRTRCADSQARHRAGLSRRRSYRPGIYRRPHPRLPLVARWTGRAARRRPRRRQEFHHRLLLRRPRPRHRHRLLLPPDGAPGGLRRRRRRACVGRIRPRACFWYGAHLGRRLGRRLPQRESGRSSAAPRTTLPDVVLFVDTSQDFSAGHTPGARWLSRSWLEIEIGDIAPNKNTAIAVTCATGRSSALAAVTLGQLGLHQRLGA